jgi:1,2-diacylglycerol 3-beta-galactosyltransferase
MANIARQLDASPDPLQLIMICGHNRKLCAELTALSTRKRIVVQGFTSDIAYFMSLADFFIGKPGPGSISEALQFNLPVIVECNDSTMPQERYNAQWLKENRLGIVLSTFRDVAAGVHQLLEKETFDEFKRNAEGHTNRALFEIPVILDEIFDIHSPRSVAASSFNSSESRGPSAAWAIST